MMTPYTLMGAVEYGVIMNVTVYGNRSVKMVDELDYFAMKMLVKKPEISTEFAFDLLLGEFAVELLAKGLGDRSISEMNNALKNAINEINEERK